MWTEILHSNRAALTSQIDGLIARLGAVSRDIASGDEHKINELLSNAKKQRDRIYG